MGSDHPTVEESIATIVASLSRCPKCHRGSRPDERGRCTKCRKRSALSKWERRTEEAPVQVEELNGRVCRECESAVTVMFPMRRANLGPVYFFVAITSGIAATVSLQVWPAIFLFFALEGFAVLALEWATHRGVGPWRLFRTTIVICNHCETTRIGNGENVGRFLRGRARVARLRKLMIPALLFLLLTGVLTWITTGRLPRTQFLAYAVLGFVYVVLEAEVRIYFPPAERWRDRWFPR